MIPVKESSFTSELTCQMLARKSRPWWRSKAGLLTAHHCAGIAFAGVHDSFWTHAADVPVLARLLREAFVDLHSQPLLQDLHDELTAHRPGPDGTQAISNNKNSSQHDSKDLQTSRPGREKPAPQIPDPPALGDLDLNQVREAQYFFN